jgi:tRNA(His) guanylyltransferase
MGKDELGNRMKNFYENRSQTYLTRRVPVMMRLDGKSFHTYTKNLERPYDLRLMRIMDDTAIALCEQIQGAKMAFVQSDEITILITDYETIKTAAWFDYNVQKMTSISASIATAAFNNGMYLDEEIFASMSKVAHFDSRVWQVPDIREVADCFIWRQQDATRNSIQMGAQQLYSQKQLDGKNTSQLQELMFQKGVNWDKYPVGFKRSRIILKEKIEKKTIPSKAIRFIKNKPALDQKIQPPEIFEVEHKIWASFEPPIFTQDREFLLKRIPTQGIEDGK